MPTSPIGIIDSLASGFEIVAAHLQILVLPLGLDLFLWLGPRVSLRPFLNWIEQIFTNNPYGDPASQEGYRQIANWAHDLAQVGAERYLPILLPPTVLGGRRVNILPFDFKPPLIESWAGSAGTIVMALVSGLLIYEICYGWIALYVLGEPFRFWRFTRQIASIAGQSLLAAGISSGIAFAVLIMVISMISLLLVLGGPDMAFVAQFLFLLFVATVVIPACSMAAFTLHSMFLNRRNVISALWDSIRVVQWNMFPTTMLLAIIVLIYWALNSLWALADRSSWVILAAMVGNAFISTGLIAATLVFYQDRYRYWREFREALLAELERRRIQQDNNRQI